MGQKEREPKTASRGCSCAYVTSNISTCGALPRRNCYTISVLILVQHHAVLVVPIALRCEGRIPSTLNLDKTVRIETVVHDLLETMRVECTTLSFPVLLNFLPSIREVTTRRQRLRRVTNNSKGVSHFLHDGGITLTVRSESWSSYCCNT